MKLSYTLALLVASATMSITTPPLSAVEVSVSIHAEADFYEPLTPYGRWEVVSGTRCFIPGQLEVDWRPYSNGTWQRTEAGWYWASDEPFGWATYHYGRWDRSAEFGWYWTPQVQWAPAWVSWHNGGGYVGWSPLPRIGISVGVIEPRAVVFVQERNFLEPIRPRTIIVNNTTIIKNTVVINEGPHVEVIAKASGHKVVVVQAQELRQKHEAKVVIHQQKSPVRTEPAARETKAVSAPAPHPTEKPAVAAHEGVKPAAGKPSVEREHAQPAHRPVDEKNNAKHEAKPATQREGKPAATHKPERQAPSEKKHEETKEKPGNPK